MSNPPTLTELEELYFELSAAYASPYSDNADDIHQSALKLRQAIMRDNQTRETLLQKIKLLRQQSGQFKTKLSLVISDRFWNKQLTQPIKPTFYKPDEPVL